MTDKRELMARLRDECSRRVGRKHFSRSDVEMVEACTAGADAIQRELDATAAPSDILPIDGGSAADWLDRASSKWENGPAAINPADALRLRSISALLRATAAPVVVGEVTDEMICRFANVYYGRGRTYGPDRIREALTAALAGD